MGGRIAAMATQRRRKAETSSPPRRSARAKLLVRAEDRGFEPRRALPPNRISSAFPLVTGRSGNDRDRTEWQVSRAGNAGIVPGPAADARRVRTRNGHTHTTEMPVIAGPLPWPGVYRRCGRSWSAPCRPAGEPRSCPGPHRSRPGRPRRGGCDRVMLGGPAGQHLPGLPDHQLPRALSGAGRYGCTGGDVGCSLTSGSAAAPTRGCRTTEPQPGG